MNGSISEPFTNTKRKKKSSKHLRKQMEIYVFLEQRTRRTGKVSKILNERQQNRIFFKNSPRYELKGFKLSVFEGTLNVTSRLTILGPAAALGCMMIVPA